MPKKYSKNFLNEVIFQIKYPPILDLYQNKKITMKLDSATGKPIESNTDDEFYIWTFYNFNGKHVELNAKQLTLSYNGELYDNFNSFLEDINLIISSLENYSVKKATSIGLRYINQIKIEDFNNLNEYINPKLHITDSIFDEDIIQSLSRIDLKIKDYNLGFQYGQFNPEFPNVGSKKDYILDFDCIYKGNTDLKDICEVSKEMNDIIYNKFEFCIEDKLRDDLNG